MKNLILKLEPSINAEIINPGHDDETTTALKNIDNRHIYYNSIAPISSQNLEAFEPEHQIVPTDFYSRDAVGRYIPDFPLN